MSASDSWLVAQSFPPWLRVLLVLAAAVSAPQTLDEPDVSQSQRRRIAPSMQQLSACALHMLPVLVYFAKAAELTANMPCVSWPEA